MKRGASWGEGAPQNFEKLQAPPWCRVAWRMGMLTTLGASPHASITQASPTSARSAAGSSCTLSFKDTIGLARAQGFAAWPAAVAGLVLLYSSRNGDLRAASGVSLCSIDALVLEIHLSTALGDAPSSLGLISEVSAQDAIVRANDSI